MSGADRSSLGRSVSALTDVPTTFVACVARSTFPTQPLFDDVFGVGTGSTPCPLTELFPVELLAAALLAPRFVLLLARSVRRVAALATGRSGVRQLAVPDPLLAPGGTALPASIRLVAAATLVLFGLVLSGLVMAGLVVLLTTP